MLPFFRRFTWSHSYLIQLIAGLVLFLAVPGWGQDIIWTRTYGGSGDEGGHGVCQTFDGGYIIVGPTTSYWGSVQVYMIKTDGRGDTLWTKTYGGWGQDVGNSVRQTTDGAYIVAGWTSSFGSATQVYLIKTDSNGDTLWAKTYGGGHLEYGTSVQQTSDGGYIIAGGTKSYGAGEYDVYLIKTDSTGGVQWTRTYGGIRDDPGYWVERTSDGGYIVTGYTESFAPHRGVYLLKTDSEGDTLWTRVYYPWYSDWNHGFCCQQTEDGGYIVSGYSVDNTTGNCYFSLIKTDPEGDTLWTRTYGGFRLAWGRSVRQTHDGGYIVVGHFYSHESGYKNDIYIVKTDQEGDTLWTRSFGGSEGDVALDVLQTSDGTYIVVGATASHGAGSGDAYLLKISASPLPALRGDATGDGVTNASDVVYLVNYVLKGGPTPEPLKTGDANCDLWIDLEDVIYLIRYLFLHGPEPGLGCDKTED